MSCICCQKNSRLLHSKKICELQVIFYRLLPCELVREISEYLYPSDFGLIEIHYVEDWNGTGTGTGTGTGNGNLKMIHNCSSCFLYNFLHYRLTMYRLKMPRLRADIHWFNCRILRQDLVSFFNFYYDDIDKFVLPLKYNMRFYRSFDVDRILFSGTHLDSKSESDMDILNNPDIKQIIITHK